MPRSALFELEPTPDWGYEPRYFLDNEHRYTKMHRLLREGYGDLSGRRIVDLGCCRGQFLARFARYPGIQLEGLEIMADEMRQARERGISVSCHYINVFAGRTMVARLPFEESYCDVVLAGEIIEHVVDTEGFLREVARVLVPGGAVVVSTPNILWWKNRYLLLAGRYPDCLDYRLRYGDDFGHVRMFSPDTLRSLLEETGFADIRIVGKRLGPISSLTGLPTRLAHSLDRLADRLPSLSDHTIALARKPRR